MIFKSNFYTQFKGFKDLLFLLVFTISFSQSISAQIEINTIPAVLSKMQMKTLSKKSNDYTAFTFKKEDFQSFFSGLNNENFILKIGNKTWEFETTRKKVWSESGFISIYSDKGVNHVSPKPHKVYVGNIKNNSESRVSFYFSENIIKGIIKEGDKTYILSPLNSFDKKSANGLYILTDARTKKAKPFKCNVELPMPQNKNTNEENCATGAPNLCVKVPILDDDGVDRTLELAIATDYEYFQLYGNSDDLEATITAGITEVSNIYENFVFMDVEITHLEIWETPNDPYNLTGDMDAAMKEFGNYWNDNRNCIHRDIAQFITGKDVWDFVGVAWTAIPFGFPELCDYGELTSDRRSYTMIEAAQASPNFFNLSAHEIGHKLSLGHTTGTVCAGQIENICNGPEQGIMCPEGLEVNSWFRGVEQCKMWKFITENSCLTESDALPDPCTHCVSTYGIEADNRRPTLGCELNELIEYTINVCNSCKENRDITIYARSNKNFEEVVDSGDFPLPVPDPNSPNNFDALILEEVFFNADECKTFRFNAKIVNLPQVTGSYLTNVKITLDDSSIPPPFKFVTINANNTTTIDGTVSPVKLSELIDADIFEAPNEDCNTGVLNVEVDGIFEIDEPEYCFSSSTQFLMQSGAKIVIKNGAALEINGSNILACSDMWESIEVENGGTLIVDNAIFEDGYTAIRAMPGSTVSITNSKFDRNFIGIYAPNGGVNFGVIGGNAFDGGGDMLSPNNNTIMLEGIPEPNGKAFAGIWVDATLDYNNVLSVTGGNAENPHSLFKNLTNGIATKNVHLIVQKSIFNFIFENGYPQEVSGFGIRAEGGGFGFPKTFRQQGLGKFGEVSFSGCTKGIKVQGMRVGYIRNNNMSIEKEAIRVPYAFDACNIKTNNIRTGDSGINVVQWDASFATDIYNNNVRVEAANGIGIQLNMVGITPSNNQKPKVNDNFISLKGKNSTGIYLQAARNAEVIDNIVNVDDGNNAPNQYTAMRLNAIHDTDVTCNNVTGNSILDSPNYGMDIWDGENSFFSCNHLSNTETGISFTMGSTMEQQFKETTFNTHSRGLVINASAAIGTQPHHGNLWAGEYLEAGAVNLAETVIGLENSLFTVHNTTSDYYTSIFVNTDLGLLPEFWFSIDTDPDAEPSDDCGTLDGICPIEFSPAPTGGSIDDKIKEGLLDFPDFNDELTWLSERYLYRKLSNPEFEGEIGTSDEVFINTTETTTVGEFYGLENQISELFTSNETINSELNNQLSNLSDKLDQLTELDNELSGAINQNLAIERNNIIAEITTIGEGLADLKGEIQTQRSIDAGRDFKSC